MAADAAELGCLGLLARTGEGDGGLVGAVYYRYIFKSVADDAAHMLGIEGSGLEGDAVDAVLEYCGALGPSGDSADIVSVLRAAVVFRSGLDGAGGFEVLDRNANNLAEETKALGGRICLGVGGVLFVVQGNGVVLTVEVAGQHLYGGLDSNVCRQLHSLGSLVLVHGLAKGDEVLCSLDFGNLCGLLGTIGD